jgi:hypothetical protein
MKINVHGIMRKMAERPIKLQSAHNTVPAHIPQTLDKAEERDLLMAVWTVKKKMGPGVTTATAHMDDTIIKSAWSSISHSLS